MPTPFVRNHHVMCIASLLHIEPILNPRVVMVRGVGPLPPWAKNLDGTCKQRQTGWYCCGENHHPINCPAGEPEIWRVSRNKQNFFEAPENVKLWHPEHPIPTGNRTTRLTLQATYHSATPPTLTPRPTTTTTTCNKETPRACK